VSNAKRNLARSRSIARKCAMQSLYQWQLTQQSSDEIGAQFIGGEELKGGDVEYFSELLRECAQNRDVLDAALSEFLDRSAA
jgi:N utilization substance protein B